MTVFTIAATSVSLLTSARTANASGDFHGIFMIDVRHDDLRTFAGQTERQLLADSLAGSGDDRDFLLQNHFLNSF
jgi:hypothetical protein